MTSKKLEDIFDNVKERLSNPLMFSFLLAWLIQNWEITLSIIFFNARLYEKEGFSNLFEFIKHKLSLSGSIWIPIAFAFLYTLIIPILKNLINAFNAWAFKWGNKWRLNIAKGGAISINKYLSLRSDYQRAIELLQEAISQESIVKEDYNRMRAQFLEVQSMNNSKQAEINEKANFIHSLNDISILNGYWTNTYQLENSQEREENVYIDNGRYYTISPMNEKVHKFDIVDFYYNAEERSVFFVKELIPAEKQKRDYIEHYNCNRLKFEGQDTMAGTENRVTDIVYRRK